MINYLLPALLIAVVVYFFFLKKGGNFPSIDSQEFQQKMKAPDAVILDVRSSAEFSSGHIPGAKNIDVMSGAFASNIANLDKSKTYLVYCRSGARSARACGMMEKAGHTQVFNLASGIMGWTGKVVK